MYRLVFLFVALMACKGQSLQYQQLQQSQQYQQPGQLQQNAAQPQQQSGQLQQQNLGQQSQQNLGQPIQQNLALSNQNLINFTQVTLPTSCANIRNAYIDQGLCDSYIECRNFKPTKRVCPDGLNYNSAAKWPAYPCSYPNEAPCRGRQQIQVSKPTAECERQYGIFSSPKAAANECGRYIICSAGYAYDMTCPIGLAFNPATSSCDWPYNVPSCNMNDFYGLTCPPAEIDESGNPVVVNLKYGNDCQYFFSCQTGLGRLLKCDPGYAFNAASGRCENADYVDCTAQGTAEIKPIIL